MPLPQCDCAVEPPMDFSSFGAFACAACEGAGGPTFPFTSSSTLEDLADLYLYRFDDTLDFHALGRVAAELQQSSGHNHMDPKAFEITACNALQVLANDYFRTGWDDERLVASNSVRLQALRRQYPVPRDCQNSPPSSPCTAPRP
eukprot:GGOE01019479.1.p1 GENE.GGOE01019479.1~~GGOE01019479.1.p1  ORF type:complete len:145 (-),score=36.98 GGOE01019479.1:123-557(-)